MKPTLLVGDIVRPLEVTGPLRRGVVVVLQGPDTVRIDRVVAVGGDMVAVHAGHVVLNGATIPLRDRGSGPMLDGAPSRQQAEQLPGEARPHLILDAGISPSDEFGPVRVPAGHLFVLGDNRDRAADSRIPLEEMGVGLVPVSAVIGVVDRLLWSKGMHDIGRTIDMPRQVRS